ncbi:zf-DNL-domain-containing protein [Aspergillus aurantiobrunneus]
MTHSLRLSRGLRVLHSAIPPRPLSRGASRLYSQLSCHQSRPSLPRCLPNNSGITNPLINFRYNSNNSNQSAPLTDRPSNPETDAETAEQNRLRREQEPAYQLTFTCKPCGNRSSHRVSKHGYHRGTVLIRCPSCENRHVISDNLNIFFDQSKTLDDLLQERGQTITRGEIQGDMEFWDDGTVTPRGSDGPKSD